jgi:hypothetical protein
METTIGNQDVQVRMKPQRGFHRDSEKAPPENTFLSSRYTFQIIESGAMVNRSYPSSVITKESSML